MTSAGRSATNRPGERGTNSGIILNAPDFQRAGPGRDGSWPPVVWRADPQCAARGTPCRSRSVSSPSLPLLARSGPRFEPAPHRRGGQRPDKSADALLSPSEVTVRFGFLTLIVGRSLTPQHGQIRPPRQAPDATPQRPATPHLASGSPLGDSAAMRLRSGSVPACRARREQRSAVASRTGVARNTARTGEITISECRSRAVRSDHDVRDTTRLAQAAGQHPCGPRRVVSGRRIAVRADRHKPIVRKILTYNGRHFRMPARVAPGHGSAAEARRAC